MTSLITPNTAKRATLVIVLLGVLGLTAHLALASGVPKPRITSGPPAVSRSRKANFRITDSQGNVTFRCSLDGARFQICGSSPGFGGLRDGLHVFLVQARTSSGNSSAPTRYAWAVDYNAPRLAVAFPSNKAKYGTPRWGAGCGKAGAGLCGTVTAPGGLKSVVVWIQQNSTRKYYNGHGFKSKHLFWNTATVNPEPVKGTHVLRATWSYPLGLPSPAGKYTVRVRAIDRIGNVNRAKTQRTLSFQAEVATQPAEALPFTVRGSAVGSLYPGGSIRTIPLTLSNLNGVPIVITGVTVTLDASNLPAGCLAGGYQITQANIPAAGVSLPANGSVTLPAQGATTAAIRMIDTGTNQDACQGATLTLAYGGSAHS